MNTLNVMGAVNLAMREAIRREDIAECSNNEALAILVESTGDVARAMRSNTLDAPNGALKVELAQVASVALAWLSRLAVIFVWFWAVDPSWFYAWRGQGFPQRTFSGSTLYAAGLRST